MSGRLAVTVDASVLSGQSRHSGLGRFTATLLDALGRRDDLEVTALATASTVLPDGVRALRTARLGRGRFESLASAARCGLDARRAGGDVLHVPAGLPPWWPTQPWVHTLHDVIPLVLEEGEHRSARRQWQRHGPRLRRADLVVADSRFSADAAISTLGLDARRVEVVYPGIDPRFRPGPRGAPRAERHGLLVVGEVSHRKGLDRAVAVLDLLSERGLAAELTVVGRVPPANRAMVASVLARSRNRARIRVAGFVDDLAACYREAACFIGASRYEGFGLPAVEAMACGTPVVAFANTATTEVVGDGGVLVEEGDVEAMATAIGRVLREPALADELRARGQARSSRFDIDRAAVGYADAYRAAAGAHVG